MKPLQSLVRPNIWTLMPTRPVRDAYNNSQAHIFGDAKAKIPAITLCADTLIHAWGEECINMIAILFSNTLYCNLTLTARTKTFVPDACFITNGITDALRRYGYHPTNKK